MGNTKYTPAQRETADFFDSIAYGWDAREKPEVFKIVEKITDRINPGPSDTVLDAGCGTGILYPFLREKGVKDILCVDVSKKMLAELRRKHPDAKTLAAAFETLEMPPACFTKIIIYNAFPHFEDRPAVFKQAFRLLKKGGTLHIVHSMTREELAEIHGQAPEVAEHFIPSDEEMKRLYAEAGFTAITVENIPRFFSCGTKA